MHSTCWKTTINLLSAIRLNLIRFVVTMLLLSSTCFVSAESMPCHVANVQYVEDAELNSAQLEVELDCSSQAGVAIPMDQDLQAGLTVYGESWGNQHIQLSRGDQALASLGDDVERKIVLDPDTRSYDFALQPLRVTKTDRTFKLVYETTAKLVEDKPFMLFAIWHDSAKAECNPTNRFSRQGCKDYGYVIGHDLDSSLVMAYPAAISSLVYAQIMTPELLESGLENRYWVVERYKP